MAMKHVLGNIVYVLICNELLMLKTYELPVVKF